MCLLQGVSGGKSQSHSRGGDNISDWREAQERSGPGRAGWKVLLPETEREKLNSSQLRPYLKWPSAALLCLLTQVWEGATQSISYQKPGPEGNGGRALSCHSPSSQATPSSCTGRGVSFTKFCWDTKG